MDELKAIEEGTLHLRQTSKKFTSLLMFCDITVSKESGFLYQNEKIKFLVT